MTKNPAATGRIYKEYIRGLVVEDDGKFMESGKNPDMGAESVTKKKELAEIIMDVVM